MGRTLAEAGYVEVLSSPFGSRSDADLLGLPPEDLRRPAVVVANPLSEDEPLLRTTAAARPVPGPGPEHRAGLRRHRAVRDRPGLPAPARGARPSAPILPVDRGPTVAELAWLEAALPDQPLRIGAVLTGATRARRLVG